jgi:hypothetical protein
MHAVNKKGTLPSSTPVVVSIGPEEPPYSITLKSADGGRKIELSTDGGVEYYTPTVDHTSSTMQVILMAFPVTHVRFTGVLNDTYKIL